jgi:predicted GNAT family acetyltransferase
MLSAESPTFPMTLTSFGDASEFLDAARNFLMTREAANNLMLGLALRFAERKQETEEHYYAVVRDDDGAVVAAAIMTPPFHLVLTDAPPEAVEMVARDLLASGRTLPGVLAPPAIAMRMGELWSAETGGRFERAMAQRIYEIEEVIEPRPVGGELRRIGPGDRELAIDWLMAFGAEVGLPGTREGAERAADALIAEERGYLWEDGHPVSMAAWAGPTPGGVRIHAVYTPPELRGGGYASACVAGLSRLLLDSGKRACFLFTDLANPTSNTIYQRIGYRPVCDIDHYRFTPDER